jgi:hypothetical protein
LPPTAAETLDALGELPHLENVKLRWAESMSFFGAQHYRRNWPLQCRQP